MFRIFRSKRQAYSYTKRMSKYLLYALGEIILVIIGILIALYINNWNQDRQEANKVETILNELLKDLETDIINADKAITLQNNKDSLIQRVLMDSVTIADYKRDGYLRNLLFNNKTMSFSNNSYESFVQHIDHIPPAYEHLLPMLNYLYKDQQVDVQGAIDKVHDYVTETLKKWTNQESWFASYIGRRQGDAYYKYVLESSTYKNEIALYKVLLIDNLNIYTVAYHHHAVIAYRAIAAALDKPLPDCVTSYMIDMPVSKLETYVADYQMEESDNVANVSLANNQLLLGFNGNSLTYELWPRTEQVFFNNQVKIRISFSLSKEGKVDTLNYQAPHMEANFIRLPIDSLSQDTLTH